MKTKDTSKDYLIVSLLREDARKTIRSIAISTDMCRVTVAHRLCFLQHQVIRKYTALVDFQKIGFCVRVLVSITLASQDIAIFGRYIQAHPALNNLYKTTKDSDYFFEMIFETQKELHVFLNDIHTAFAITDLKLSFIEQELVRESFFGNVHALSVVHGDAL